MSATSISDGSDRFGSVAEAAKRYKVSQNMIRKMIDDGRIPAAAFGRTLRVDFDQLDRALFRFQNGAR